MYDYFPPRRNKVAQHTVMGLLCCAALAFVGSALVPAYPVILQAIGLCMFVPIIQLSSRFLFTRYLYRLRQREDGETDLEIFTYRGGANMKLVCRVALGEITAAAPMTEQNRKPPAKLRRYHYHPDLASREGWVLSVTNGDGDCELWLAPDERLQQVFLNAAGEDFCKKSSPTPPPKNLE